MKKKIISIILLMIMMFLIVFAIFHITKNEVQAAQSTSSSKANTGTIVKEEGNYDPTTYGYNTNFGTWEYSNYTSQGKSGWYVPKKDGYQIYCVQPDAHIRYTWELTLDEMNQIVENGNNGLLGSSALGSYCIVTGGKCGCYLYKMKWTYIIRTNKEEEEINSYPNQITELGGLDATGKLKRSPVYWTANSTNDLPPAMAYIISDQPKGTWTDEKQKGIWNLAGTGLDNGLVSSSANGKGGSSKYDTVANNYAGYDKEVRRQQGLNPTDQTNTDNAKTKVNRTSSEWIIGPFKVNYTNGTYGNTSFSGISEIVGVGYDSSGNIVQDNIKIKAIIYGETKVSKENIKYFEPNTTTKIDEDGCIDLRNKEFQVVFDYNKISDEVKNISIKVKFKYMLANGKYTYYKGTKYALKYYCKHDTSEIPTGYHRYIHDGNCIEEGCYVSTGTHIHTICKARAEVTGYKQQPIIAVDAIRTLYEQEIVLGPDGGVPVSIDFGGKVWEDIAEGKETAIDGIYGGSDKLVSGVEVNIYRVDGELVDSTTTDERGKYEFEELSSKDTYYLEFKYNGQTYQNTLYNVKDGDEIKENYSYATETTSDRDKFNAQFAEINNSKYEKGDSYTAYSYDDTTLMISAYTGTDGKDGLIKYPIDEMYVIGENDEGDYSAIYEDGDSQKNIDFGITVRTKFDMALKKDVYMATVKINGKTEVYGYDKKNISSEDRSSGDTWNISVVGGYERGIDDSDYAFAGQNGNNQLLEVYITYKIAVRNQSMTMLGEVTKLTDYYDSTYEYMSNMSWISDKNYTTNTTTLNSLQNQMEIGDIKEEEKPDAQDKGNGKLEINIGEKQESGQTKYLYLTFKIKGNGSNLKLGEKENKVEISAFKTYYKAGTVLPHYAGENNYTVRNDNMIAGRFDKDSVPTTMGANGAPGQDDEDSAPGLKVELTGDSRKLNGTVWEDERTETVDGAKIGNGIRDSKEIGIVGVKVQLVEKTVQGKEYIWQETTTGSDGTYKFEGYIPGDYVVRFAYGDSADTVKIKDNGGKNDVSYSGQDFQSTIYQAGVTQSTNTDSDGNYHGYTNGQGQNETGGYGYNISTSEELKVSDAKDIWSSRESVNNYSNNNGNGVTNYLAEVLASPYNNSSDSLINELINGTKMTAETGVIVVEVEKDMQTQLENGTPSYTLKDIDLGLVERAKAQLEIDKSISNIKLTLADSSILFDVNKAGDNVIWKDHAEYNLASKKKNNKYEEYYGKTGKNRYSYRTEVDKIVSKTDQGLVQLTMDEEIMHGATIEITYVLKVTNVGEVDYTGTDFYYRGIKSGDTVTTTSIQVVDYVSNNLQFNSNNTINKQNGWSVISSEELAAQGLVNANLGDKVSQFNNIIQTKALSAELKPEESTTATLVLSQLITTENTSDDLTYENMVEIVKTSNTVGRRMAYSIVGNQDPTLSKASEVDASMSEKVIILPPFGNIHIYYILGIAIAVILIGGIAFIIKKVLKK